MKGLTRFSTPTLPIEICPEKTRLILELLKTWSTALKLIHQNIPRFLYVILDDNPQAS